MTKQPSQKKHALIIALSIILGLVLLFALYLVFRGEWILPQSFHIGPIAIRLYGLCLAIAALVGYFVASKRRIIYDISQEEAEGIILTLLISGFIGARLYHVISEWAYYRQEPSLIIAVWKGGLSIFGAMLGGVVGVLVYLKLINGLKQISWHKFSNILDWLIPSFAIGQAIGRFGNLLNYEVYGYPTGLPWRMYVPFQFRPALYEMYSYFHPLFLYESLASLAISLLLIRLSPKLRYGSLFFLWLFLYNSVRFFLETMRIDSVMVYGFRLNRIVAGILALVGLIAFRYITSLNATKNSFNS